MADARRGRRDDRRRCAAGRARSGCCYAPDPGAAEQSQLGGNIATNAGGPHAFKYGVTGTWVTGLEVVLAPGELVTVGGPIRKDVAGYDTQVADDRLRGDARHRHRGVAEADPGARGCSCPSSRSTPTPSAGCEAMAAVLASGSSRRRSSSSTRARSARRGPPSRRRCPGRRFMLIAEADGSTAEAHRVRAELIEVLADGALTVHAPDGRAAIARAVALARRRLARGHRTARRQGLSEDIVVPVERLRRRSTRPVRSAPVTGCMPAVGATPATATSTRRS